MEERLEFLSRHRKGERVTDLCREFGISRKTAYKFVARYKEHGALGLLDQRRVPERIPHRTSAEVTKLIVTLRREHPTWGPKKLVEVLRKKHPDTRFPSRSTIGEILERNGLIVRKRRRKHHAPVEHSALSVPSKPNDLWCIDFKGQFRLGNGRYCYPLTVTDAASRYVLACEADRRAASSHRPRASVQDAWLAQGDSLRRRFSVREHRADEAVEVVSVVGVARYQARTDRSWVPAAERSSRTYAPDAQG